MLNEFSAANLLADDAFIKGLTDKLGHSFTKADTLNTSTGLTWYDLSPIVQWLYPFKELIPLISKLPRKPGSGGTAHRWKRITAVNVNNVSLGVSEGNRGARIALTEQDQLATYKTLGLESSTTWEARLAAVGLRPDALGTQVASTLHSVLIGEEQTLILGNASTALGTTPTPTLTQASGTSSWTTANTVYVMAVALSGFGRQTYTPWNNASSTGGILGQITKVNADNSTDTFGGGSAAPSAEANIAIGTNGNLVTATVAAVTGAVGYAWFIGTASGAERWVGNSSSNQVTFGKNASGTAQPITSLKVSGSYVDNSTNSLLPDGILSQMFGNVFGGAPGTTMATNPTLPSANIGTTTGGSLVYTMPNGNTGLTVSNNSISEFDYLFQAAFDQYKIPFDRILVSSTDLANFSSSFFTNNTMFRTLFDADQTNGRIVAGRRVTSYMNKMLNKTLDVDVHPFVPPGTIIFWSDKPPYELADVDHVLCARERQSYYQIEWPPITRRYEYGVYCDEVFEGTFMPAFAAITNLNPSTGNAAF